MNIRQRIFIYILIILIGLGAIVGMRHHASIQTQVHRNAIQTAVSR